MTNEKAKELSEKQQALLAKLESTDNAEIQRRNVRYATLRTIICDSDCSDEEQDEILYMVGTHLGGILHEPFNKYLRPFWQFPDGTRSALYTAPPKPEAVPKLTTDTMKSAFMKAQELFNSTKLA